MNSCLHFKPPFHAPSCKTLVWKWLKIFQNVSTERLFQSWHRQYHLKPGVPLQSLFHDDPQRCYLVVAGSLLAKSCLLISTSVVTSVLHPLQYYWQSTLLAIVRAMRSLWLLHRLNSPSLIMTLYQEAQLPILENVFHIEDLIKEGNWGS